MSDGLRAALLVGTGGLLGSVLRYAVAGWVQRLDPSAAFPYGTLAVNGLGCLAIGTLAGLADARSLVGADARLFAMIGMLGGFTTFSTFAYETLALLREGEHVPALLNVGGSVLLGLVAAWAGYALGSAR